MVLGIESIGTDSDNELLGTNNNDYLYGKKGNDLLKGGGGDDIYAFNLGDGQDIINDEYKLLGSVALNAGFNDVIRFGAGITKANTVFSFEGNNLIIRFKDQAGNFTQDKLTVTNQKNSYNQIEKFVFQDGTFLTDKDVLNPVTPPPVDPPTPPVQDEIINGTNLANILTGSDKNNQIFGFSGNDSIAGGKGNDSLFGGAGDDLYAFNLGDGQDAIVDDYKLYNSISVDAGMNDKIRFGAGITKTNTVFSFAGNDLVINFKNQAGSLTQDKLTVVNQKNSYNKIERFEFQDGTFLTDKDVLNPVTPPPVDPPTPPVQDEIINGTNLANILAGNDKNNQIFGFSGNDSIAGGKGNDSLFGGAGDDLYAFNLGDGQDAIVDDYKLYNSISVDAGMNDKIRFGAGITKTNTVFSFAGNDLVINFKNQAGSLTQDKLTVVNQKNSYNKIERFEFQDGTFLTDKDVLNPVTPPPIDPPTPPVQDEIINGSNLADTIVGNDKNNQIFGFSGKDIITGGKGNDTLLGGAEDDTYIFNTGDGQDTIIEDYKLLNSISLNAGTFDVVKFGAGVTKQNIAVFADSANNLIIDYKTATSTTNDKITITNWNGYNTRIERVQLSDGKYLSIADLNTIVQNIAAFETSKGIDITNVDQVKSNQELMTMVSNSWH